MASDRTEYVVHASNMNPLVLFAGVNVLEDFETSSTVAKVLKSITTELQMPFFFKASFDKANRSDHRSYRGPGLRDGLRHLEELKRTFELQIITDVHEINQLDSVARVADVIQIPAFLARQTDLLNAAAQTKKTILVKKMQMMSPEDAVQMFNKITALGAESVLVCERGTSFGYQNLVLDFQGLCEMKRRRVPLVVDVSHAVQKPGSSGTHTGGRGDDVPSLAKAVVALGVGGLFLECHPNPKQARCDGACALPLAQVADLLRQLSRLDAFVKSELG